MLIFNEKTAGYAKLDLAKLSLEHISPETLQISAKGKDTFNFNYGLVTD